VRIVAPPGVFRPLSDSWMLADALRGEPRVRDGEVLDLCCGSGALGIAAGRAGAARVTAVDVSRRAVATAQLNGVLNGVALRGRRGDLFAAVAGERFDVIVSNPPYVPAEDDELPARGPERAWNAGRDGRALLDRICAEAPGHLREKGVLLLVHSTVCGEEATLERLGAAGLDAEVAIRHPGPLGPLLSQRATMLEKRRLLVPGRREEEVLVIRGRAAAVG
jgi:release factor glutamine methyltransferase